MDDSKTRSVYWSDVAARYQRAIRSFDEFVKPVLCAHGIEHLGIPIILFLISVGDRPQRVVDLVRDQRYAGSNASYALAQLVDADLIERHPDETDARIRVVALTERGRAVLASIREASVGDPRHIDQALRTISLFESQVARPPVVLTPAEPAE